MALQNHPPFIRHWKDIYDLVREVDSPWLKICLDLPMLTQFDREFVKQAALTVGSLQTYSHFGGEYDRDADGFVQGRALDFEKPIPDYGYFLGLMGRSATTATSATSSATRSSTIATNGWGSTRSTSKSGWRRNT